MSNGSSHQAVRPLVNGQQQNQKPSFFAQAAQWAMQALKTGRTQGKPPRIPVEIDYGNGRDFFHGRGMFKAMFDRMAANDAVDIRGWDAEDIESEFMDPVLDALLALHIHPETPIAFNEFRSELKKLGFDSHGTLEECIEHEMDPKEGSFGDDEFDFEPPDDTPSPAKPARESVADMADEKSARTKEKPAKAVETFAKLFDWVNKLDISPTSKIILAEVIRHSHGCPFSWVGKPTLAAVVQRSERQIIRILQDLESAGHITTRPVPYLATQRLIFVNRLAESAGIDPKTISLPENKSGFWAFRARFNGQNKPKKPKRVVTTTAGIKADNSGNVTLYNVSPVSEGRDAHVTRRDKGFSAPNGAEKTHTPNVVSTSPPKGVLPPPGVEGKAKPTPSAKPVPQSEHAAVEAKKVSTARPPMDWPERNLPTVNRESALARMVRLGRVTHLHPRWLDGLACWVVRLRTVDGKDVFLPPKSMDDGWIVNTVDTVVVPTIDSENRRVSQAEFCRLLANGHIVAPDPDKPVIESEMRV